MSGSEKQPLVPRLRFPEFRDAGEWKATTLGECLDYQQPTDYLVSDTSYSENYDTPVLTAGKTFVLGYTNEKHGIFSQGLPVIIFDDFTTATQFVDFPFKAKSSAMKILQAKNGENIKFLYELLQNTSYEVGAHERHWISKFAPMPISTPCPGEQQKIADCLSSLDELITTENRKLDTLITHKKGLLQQLFPRDGEVVPRLRFPEFRSAGSWSKVTAGELFLNRIERGRPGLPIYSVTMTDGLVPRASLDRKIDDIAEASANKTVRTGDLAYNMMRMWQGALGIAPEDCMVSPAYIVLEPQGVNSLFFYYLLKRPQSLQVLTAHSRGLTEDRLRLYYDDFAKISLQCPSPPEQDRIADCLISIDKLIATQSQKVDVLKAFKKGLIRQMFPVSDEVPA